MPIRKIATPVRTAKSIAMKPTPLKNNLKLFGKISLNIIFNTLIIRPYPLYQELCYINSFTSYTGTPAFLPCRIISAVPLPPLNAIITRGCPFVNINLLRMGPADRP